MFCWLLELGRSEKHIVLDDSKNASLKIKGPKRKHPTKTDTIIPDVITITE